MTNHFIDYDDSDESPIRWTAKDLRTYWKKLYLKHFKGTVQWGIKETTLLSKLMKTYSVADLGDMMCRWMEDNKEDIAHKFGFFYQAAPAIHSKVVKERAEWEWNFDQQK